jgi:hypothetical protein
MARQSFRALNRLTAPFVKCGVGSPPVAGLGTVVVGTTGRTSKKTREVPLAAARLGDTVIVSTVRANADWLRNLEADPHATVWLHGTGRPASATVTRLPGLGLSFLRLAQRGDPSGVGDAAPDGERVA